MQVGIIFWRSWNPKMKYTNWSSSKSRWEKRGHLSRYHVNSQSYGHENVKNGSFFIFSADDSKILVLVWASHLNAPERSYSVLSENGVVNRLWSYRLWDIEGRNIIKNCWVGKKHQNPVFSRVYYATGSSEANIPHHFLKQLNKIFQMDVNYRRDRGGYYLIVYFLFALLCFVLSCPVSFLSE